MTCERLRVGRGEVSFEPAFFEHVLRYRFVASQILRGRLLDVACGSGYGSALLASPELLVTGVDISPEAISFCRRQYARNGIDFLVMNAESLAFATEVFEVVVCFETIEHLRHPERMLTGIARVLRPGGRLFISTPVRGVYEQTFLGDNPYHTREWTPEEFQWLLSGFFRVREMHGQRYHESMRASPERLQQQNQYRKSLRFLAKRMLRRHVFNKSWTYPLFWRFSSKVRENRVVPYSNDLPFKILLATCTRT